jgi:hypothetical protein
MDITQYIGFIKESRKRGFEDQTIRNALIKKGWPENEIELAFNTLDKTKKDSYFKEKGVEKQELKNEITLFLDDELMEALEKRAKKNMFTISEQIEDILRRSTLNLKGKKSGPGEKLDDTLVGIFSRKNTGPKKKKVKKNKK